MLILVAFIIYELFCCSFNLTRSLLLDDLVNGFISSKHTMILRLQNRRGYYHFSIIQVNYFSMDGSSNNRSFLKMHFKSDPAKDEFATTNIHNPSKKIVFLMDPSVSTPI